MDKNGQLTFSDDPLLNSTSEAYQLLEEGNFELSAAKFDSMMTLDPDYPGVIEGYRTAKFWNNRHKELMSLEDGKQTADFLMRQWEVFEKYSTEKSITGSAAYYSIMRHIFNRASEHYRTAYIDHQDTPNDFNLLLNLGSCFLRLEDYKKTIETLEFARNSYSSNAKLLFILAEAYFHENEIPKCLLYFKEAFNINPSDLDLSIIKSKPILQIIESINETKIAYKDIKEWIPVYGFLTDIFYVRKNLSKHQIDTLQDEIYNLETAFQKMSKDQIDNSNVKPTLINKYIWMLDYYEFQNYNFENIVQIRDRLINIDKDMFKEYFSKKKS